MHEAWVLKHRPRTLSEVIGNKESIQQLLEWTRSWNNGIPKKRAVFLYGPPGIGKTVSVEALANDLGMEFVEKNASDYRTEEAIKHFAGLASRYGSLFGRKRIILLDELDGLTGNADRGGVKAITDVVKSSQAPIVLIANSAYDPRFTALRPYCMMIEFKKLPAGEIAKLLERVCGEEHIQPDEQALKFIAQRSDGDVRSALNDLQALAQGKMKLNYDDVSWLGYRDRQDTIFNVLRMILYAKTAASAKQAVNMADVDIDMLFEWIFENVPAHLADKHDLAEAMNALSIADVYRGRIQRTQDYSFTRYVIDYMTAGVAMARQNTKAHGWIPFKFPERIQALSRSRAERSIQRSIGQKIKRRNHISAVRATREVLPFLRIIFKNDINMASKIAKELDLEPEMIEYVAGSDEKAREIAKLAA